MNIFFSKNLLYFFFYFSTRFLIRCDTSYGCESYTNCYDCVLCQGKNSLYCNCIFTINNCTSYNSLYSESSGWYSKASTCENLENRKKGSSAYCPSSSSLRNENDLDNDKSITFTILSDRYGLYGSKNTMCSFQYEQSVINNLQVKVEFTSGVTNVPKVYIESTDVYSAKRKEYVESNKELYFTQCSKVLMKVLLLDNYFTSPIKIKISINSSKFGTIVSIMIIIIMIGIMVGCVVFCVYRMYQNNQARRAATLYMYQQAQANMARIEQENGYYEYDNQEESVDIEKINKEKLDQLFKTTMAEHHYKKHYNEFGGGCSICLADFKKKSKVSITSCKHVFHYDCIHDWLYKNIRNPKCPNCNNEILNDDENKNKKEKDNKIIKVKRKAGVNQQNTNEIGNVININNNGENGEFSQSQRPQLDEYQSNF
jgi:Tfp pilus assembly protein PilE